MIDKTKIKVVKRESVNDLKKAGRRVQRSQQAAREIVNNVTDWVAELKQRKGEEAKAAIDLLFASRPEPSNP
jgi:hypothetical protein